MKYAVVALSGSQFLIKEDEVFTVDKLDQKEGEVGKIDQVLLTVDDEKVTVGNPHVDGVTVEYKVIRNYQGKKLRVFKYKAKSRYRLTQGFRPQLSDIQIISLGFGEKIKKVETKKTTVKNAEVKEVKTKKTPVKKVAVAKVTKVTKK